jgi:hypothetical protein
MLLFIPTDPDFFWHLKYGELTLDQGPISHNPFSHTFTNYQFLDFEWLSNLLIYILYKVGSFYILGIAYALLVALALIVSVNIGIKKKPNRQSKIITIFIALVVISPVIGIRPQMVSILGSALIYMIVNKFLKTGTKAVFLIPIIMFFWINLHPGFLSGFIILSIFILAEFIKSIQSRIRNLKNDSSKHLKTLIIITILSILTTLITPYSYGLLKESLVFSFDNNAYKYISEWSPLNFQSINGKITIFYMILVLVTFFRRKNISIAEILLNLCFGLMSLQSIRHIPLFVIVSLPSILACRDWDKLWKLKFEGFIIILAKFSFLVCSFAIITFNIYEFTFTNSNILNIYNRASYPYNAVQFLKQQEYEGNIFNEYGWGGFLIWEYPQKKTFIDGRMTSWKMNKENILEEYINITELKTPAWEEKLIEHDIEVVLLDKDTPLGNVLRVNLNWIIIYEDNVSLVMKKK